MLSIPSFDWDIKQARLPHRSGRSSRGILEPDRGAFPRARAVRGPLTDLLLVIYKRRPARGDGIKVFGDTALLDFWLERVSFE